MTNELFNSIVRSLIDRALDARSDEIENNSEYDDGRSLAYYEILDTVKNRLILYEYDLSECGLDVDLEKTLFGLKERGSK